ncbi:MAG TPA: lipase secretion chaperone [Rhizobacter sp.]
MTRLGFQLSIAAAAAAMVLGVWLVASPPDDPEPGPAVASQPPGTTDVRPPPRPAGSAPTSVADATRLLELGVAGDLTIDMHTRSALDLLLDSLGPDPSAADLQRLEEQLRRSMPGEAATQAMALVRRYAGYQRAAQAEAAAQQPPATAQELEALLDKNAALRRKHFDDATARALFGAEEEQTRLDLAMNAVQADPKLSPQEKAAQIQALRERAPRDLPGLQAPVPAAHVEMENRIASLRQQGATPAQIEQVRRQYLGDEAARALAESEAQAAHWEARYQAYAQQKKAIVAAAPPDMSSQLESALRQHFSEEELAAARAYDRARSP